MKLIHRNHTFTVIHERDNDHDAPWEEDEGHGIVSKWRRTSAKRPGERVLAEDHGSYRFYDVAAAMKIALRDGWGVKGGRRPGESKRAYAARAVEKDFEYLRAWCNDEWEYIGVIVKHGEYQESLWGIESNTDEYLDEVARELADEIIGQLETRAAQARIDEGAAYGCTL